MKLFFKEVADIDVCKKQEIKISPVIIFLCKSVFMVIKGKIISVLIRLFICLVCK